MHNTDSKPFEFTAALHSYIEVLAVEQAKVRGLKGLTYLDKGKDPKNPETKVEDRDAIGFSSYVDSVYLNAPEHVELDVGTGAAVAIDSTGWEDCVVWNPWTTMEVRGGAGRNDTNYEGHPDVSGPPPAPTQACYKNFVCVENAKFGKAASVEPGACWTATANFNVQDSK